MVRPTRPENAPGYKCKANRDSTWREYWSCRTDIAKRGYMPTHVRLHYPNTLDGRATLAARCTQLQGEMLSWAAHGGQFVRPGYGGNVASLARQFQTHEDSPYRRMRASSQRTFDAKIKIIAATVGLRQVRELTGSDFLRWHRQWRAPKTEGARERPFRARGCIDVVRAMVAFGATMAWRDCAAADAILGRMRFPVLPVREVQLTWAHCQAIRVAAHRMGLQSIALAQTLMFETGLRQGDLIGRWEQGADGEGGIARGGKRWVGGVTWSDLGENLVLFKKTSKTLATVAFDLKLCASVLEEIELVSPERRIGPLVVSEKTGRPYTAGRFSRTWRKVARAAGVPDEVQNRDSRAGSISEAYAAEAQPGDIMRFAGHATQEMSSRYNRTTVEQTARVTRLRAAKRDGNEV